MKTLYHAWAAFTLFRAGFILGGYFYDRSFVKRCSYAFRYTRRWVKSGAGRWNNRHLKCKKRRNVK